MVDELVRNLTTECNISTLVIYVCAVKMAAVGL